MDDQRKNARNFLNSADTRTTLEDVGVVTQEVLAVEVAVSRPPGSGFGVRHLQIFMAFAFLVVNIILQVNISVAIISMTNLDHTSSRYPVYEWNEEAKDTILSSFFWGYILVQIVAGNLSEKFGSKMIMAGGVIVASLMNFVLPLIAGKGVTVVCGLRMSQGAVQGIFWPCVVALLSKWVPPAERSTAIPLTFSGALAGMIVVFPLSGYLATSPFGWPSVFYVTSAIGLVWTIAWLLIGASTPSDHTSISKDERQFIETSLNHGLGEKKKKLKTPWKKIGTSVPVWALTLAHCGQNWGFWTLATQMPKYINSVLGVNIRGDGLLSALPFMCSWTMALIYAWVSRVLQNHDIMSRTGQIKLWNSIALWGSSLMLLIHGLTSPRDSTLVVILFILTMGLNAGVNSGIFANHVELSPNFGGTLMGITNTIANVASIFGPLTVGWIVRDPESAAHWKPVFILASAVMFVTNLFYVLFGSAKVQSWNEPETVENNLDQRKMLFGTTRKNSPHSGAEMNGAKNCDSRDEVTRTDLYFVIIIFQCSSSPIVQFVTKLGPNLVQNQAVHSEL